MKSHINIYITKLRRKIEMYSAFLIYIMGGTFYNSIDGIVVCKNSEDVYPYYFFTPLLLKGKRIIKRQNFMFKYKFSEVL